MRREVYTPSVSRVHFSDTFSSRGVQTSRTRMAQGVCSAHVTPLHVTLSILMFHPPSLLFPHGHFDTSFPSAPSLPNCSRSEMRVKRTSALTAGSLATWPIPRTPQVFDSSVRPHASCFVTCHTALCACVLRIKKVQHSCWETTVHDRSETGSDVRDTMLVVQTCITCRFDTCQESFEKL